MKRIIAALLLLTFTQAFAGQYSIPSLKRVGNGLGLNYFYTRISTTGWHVIQTNDPAGAAGTCTYTTPELQSASSAVMAILGNAPDSISWDVQFSTLGEPICANVVFSGAGQDNMTYVDPVITEQEVTLSSAHVYTGPNNLSPIVVSTVVILGVPYTKYTISHTPGIAYSPYSTGFFECVIAKTKLKESLIQFLGFKQEKRGVIYHIWAMDRQGDAYLGIPRCDYAYMEIASYRLSL